MLFCVQVLGPCAQTESWHLSWMLLAACKVTKFYIEAAGQWTKDSHMVAVPQTPSFKLSPTCDILNK